MRGYVAYAGNAHKEENLIYKKTLKPNAFKQGRLRLALSSVDNKTFSVSK